MPECCVSIIDELIKQRKLKGMTQLDTLLKVVSALGCHLEIVPRKVV